MNTIKGDNIITDRAIDIAWGNADFGESLNNKRRIVVRNALLKTACGFSNGHTAECIIRELGLVDNNLNLTNIGKEFLWESFKENYI